VCSHLGLTGSGSLTPLGPLWGSPAFAACAMFYAFGAPVSGITGFGAVFYTVGVLR